MAYENRTEDGEPGGPPTRVILLDGPEERDLRFLVPEAFTKYPDGLWEARRYRFYLVVSVFSTPDTWKEREHLIEDLGARGLHAYKSHSNCYQCDLFSSDVLCRFYGFQRRFRPAEEYPPGFPNARIVRKWCNCYTEGPLNNGARVSVSRAFDRLAVRGLAERRGGAINLTEQGVEVAEALMVNEGNNITPINH